MKTHELLLFDIFPDLQETFKEIVELVRVRCFKSKESTWF